MSKQARSACLSKQRELLEPEKDLDETEVAPPSTVTATESTNQEEGDCNHKKELLSRCLALLMRGWAQQPLPLTSKVCSYFLSSNNNQSLGPLGGDLKTLM